jgi:SAM-dependent methyltransferase
MRQDPMTMAQNSPQPRLVDPARLAQARVRARLDQAGFLHDEAKAELQERLIDVNRRFTAPALVTAFPDYWADLAPGARMVAPDEVLDLTPGAHDLVIHAMALHWADDPVGQIVQCRRALAPDGLFLSAAFGGETLVELRAALAQAETEVMGGLSPRVAPMAEIRDMGALLQRAGLALPVADRMPKTVTYPDVFALMADLRAMGETNALADRYRRPPPRALFARLSEVYASRFPATDDEKRIRASFEIVFLSGWAPHDSQQKPLRPGAAKARLADALGTSAFDETARPVLHPSDD